MRITRETRAWRSLAHEPGQGNEPPARDPPVSGPVSDGVVQQAEVGLDLWFGEAREVSVSQEDSSSLDPAQVAQRIPERVPVTTKVLGELERNLKCVQELLLALRPGGKRRVERVRIVIGARSDIEEARGEFLLAPSRWEAFGRLCRASLGCASDSG
jgi:hypothetical protein